MTTQTNAEPGTLTRYENDEYGLYLTDALTALCGGSYEMLPPTAEEWMDMLAQVGQFEWPWSWKATQQALDDLR